MPRHRLDLQNGAYTANWFAPYGSNSEETPLIFITVRPNTRFTQFSLDAG